MNDGGDRYVIRVMNDGVTPWQVLRHAVLTNGEIVNGGAYGDVLCLCRSRYARCPFDSL